MSAAAAVVNHFTQPKIPPPSDRFADRRRGGYFAVDGGILLGLPNRKAEPPWETSSQRLLI